MAEPWTDVQADVVEGAGFARLSPITLSGSSVIASFGTKIDLLQVTDETADYGMNPPKNEYINKTLSSGYTLEFPKIVKTISAITGYTKTAAENSQDSFEIKALLSKAKLDSILAGKSSPFACMKSLGFDTAGNHLGYAHIIGYIDAIKENIKHELMEVTLTIKGGMEFSGSTYSAYNTAMTTATIEPVGMGALTPVALTAPNYTSLCSGVIVRTAAS